MWWFSTRVYRASLPLDDMYNLDVCTETVRENSIPLSLEYDILITITNSDPENLRIHLNTQEIIDNLEPFVKALEPIANITMKSHWLSMVTLGVPPKRILDHYRIFENQVPHVITPLEKKIWSHTAPRPTINLVVHVTHCQVPIYLYNVHNSKVESHAFLSPSWGGIQILNAGEEACKKGIYKPNLREITALFKAQLKRLMGLKGNTVSDLNELKKAKAIEMIESSRKTLKSLAELLLEISSIVIKDNVAVNIKAALEYADEADELLKKDNVEEALKLARTAFYNAESAFSDPSLLALLYFPDDQK